MPLMAFVAVVKVPYKAFTIVMGLWILLYVFERVCEGLPQSLPAAITLSACRVQWEMHSESNLTTFPEILNHRYSSPYFFLQL